MRSNRFLEITFRPFWAQRCAVQPAQNSDAHRRLERTQRLEEILGVRAARTVAADHTVSWKGACRSPLEKTMEADISILRKTGHFYFVLTGRLLGLLFLP